MGENNLRLDAAESVWFKRQLEFIDQTVYNEIFPENRARTLIPTAQNIPDWAKSYTWRMFTQYGKAKIVANMADDIPRADVTATEESKIIKPCASSYGWDIFEIKASSKSGVDLDVLKAYAARFAIETEIDEILAVGNTAHNLQGLFTLTGTTSFTVPTGLSGLKTWASKTPDEIAADIAGIIGAVRTAMKGAGGPMFQKFTVIVPETQYTLIATKRMGDGSGQTVLKFILESNPWIGSIEPWYRATGAGSGATDRMVVYPKTPMVLAGIVPMEYTTLPPEQRNLEYVVNAIATVGGVVARYPVAIAYGDGI
jgi:hypothetical protein